MLHISMPKSHANRAEVNGLKTKLYHYRTEPRLDTSRFAAILARSGFLPGTILI